MSYAMKYRTGMKDISDAENTWDVQIFQKDYSGGSTTINDMGQLNFNFGETSRWMFQPVVMSDIEMGLWATSRLQYTDLASSDATKNRVDIYYKGSIYAKYYIVTDTYEEPLELHNHPVRFMAADLKLLEKYNVTLTGYNTPQQYAFHLLNKLGFDFGFRVCVATTGFLGVQAFKSLLLNAKTFDGLNGLEALREIMKPFGATCYQANGTWHISQVREKTGSLSYTDYNSSGTQTGTGSYSKTVATTPGTRENYCNLLAGGSIQVLPPVKEFTIITDLIRNNFVKNNDFSAYENMGMLLGPDNYQFDYWTKHTDDYDFVYPKYHGDTKFIVIGPEGSLQAAYIKQEIENNIGVFVPDSNYKFRITVKHAFYANKDAVNAKATYGIQVLCDGLYLDDDGATAGTFITPVNTLIVADDEPAQTFEDISFRTYTYEFEIRTGAYEIRLLEASAASADSGLGTDFGVCYTDVKLEIIKVNGNDPSEEISTTTEVNANNTYVPDDVELLFDIPPEGVKNWLEIYTNMAAPESRLSYNSEEGTLAELLANQISAAYATPPLMLRANFESDIFDIDSLLTDSEFSTRRFMPVYATLNAKYMEWAVDFISVNTDADIIPDFYGPDFDGSDFYTGE